MDHKDSHRKQGPEKFWFALDNAAKIFPAVISKKFTAVFRLTAVFRQPVKIKPLRKAVLLAERRFPYFMVQLKEGFFWYYLEYLPQHIPIETDQQVYCVKFRKGELLIRILVKNTSLSIEFSHILTDGGGALEFLKTILVLYAGECGSEIPAAYQFPEPVAPIPEEEYEDAYSRYFKEEIPPMVKRSKAFHLPYTLKPFARFSRLNAILSIKELQQAARGKGVSLTVYLVAVYLYVLQEIFENRSTSNKYKRNKRLRIQVPVNLRKIFPSRTMRNFSLFVMPEIDLRLGHYTFDEIIKSVYHQMMLETDEKLINKNIARNVGGEKKLFVRGIPLFLKSFILRMKYYSLGPVQYSGVLTNIGKVTLPEEAGAMLDHFLITPPPPNKLLKVSCGAAGFGDKMVICFGNITHSHEFEEKYLQFIRDQMIAVERSEL